MAERTLKELESELLREGGFVKISDISEKFMQADELYRGEWDIERIMLTVGRCVPIRLKDVLEDKDNKD